MSVVKEEKEKENDKGRKKKRNWWLKNKGRYEEGESKGQAVNRDEKVTYS